MKHGTYMCYMLESLVIEIHTWLIIYLEEQRDHFFVEFMSDGELFGQKTFNYTFIIRDILFIWLWSAQILQQIVISPDFMK